MSKVNHVNINERKQLKELWYVYILLCSDNKLYTGCTSNIIERMTRHSKGQVVSTNKDYQ